MMGVSKKETSHQSHMSEKNHACCLVKGQYDITVLYLHLTFLTLSVSQRWRSALCTVSQVWCVKAVPSLPVTFEKKEKTPWPSSRKEQAFKIKIELSGEDV